MLQDLIVTNLGVLKAFDTVRLTDLFAKMSKLMPKSLMGS